MAKTYGKFVSEYKNILQKGFLFWGDGLISKTFLHLKKNLVEINRDKFVINRHPQC